MYEVFIFFPCIVHAKIWHALNLLLLFKFLSSARLSNSLYESDILLFLRFIYIVSILFYKFIEFIILLYTFLVICFDTYFGYIACFYLYQRLGNVRSICLRLTIFNPFLCGGFDGNIPLLKAKLSKTFLVFILNCLDTLQLHLW